MSTLPTPVPRPIAVAVEGNGTMYVLGGNSAVGTRVYKLTPVGVLMTLAGSGFTGSADGPGATASFNFSYNGSGASSISALALDTQSNLYVTEPANHTVRKITPAGQVSTLAGAAGVAGSTDGPGATARFNSPAGIAVDGAGVVYVADRGNYTVRKISAAGDVSRFAGIVGMYSCINGPADTAKFTELGGLCVDEAGVITVLDRLCSPRAIK